MILKFQKTISTGNQNSYKFALGFSILDRYEGSSRLAFSTLSETIAKAYYRNHIVFRLRETNNASQEPNAMKIILRYLEQRGLAGQPPRQLRGSDVRELGKLLSEPPADWGRSFFAYVLPCWQGASRDSRGHYLHPKRGVNEFFSYDAAKKEIELSDSFMTCIDSHKVTLLNLTIFEWAQFLEKFNLSPNPNHQITNEETRKKTREISKSLLHSARVRIHCLFPLRKRPRSVKFYARPRSSF